MSCRETKQSSPVNQTARNYLLAFLCLNHFCYFASYFVLGNPVELPIGRTTKPKRNTSNLVLIIFILLLCGAYILGTISISKYQDLRNDISNMNSRVGEEISQNVVEEEITSESNTNNESDSSILSCEHDPCKNNGTCVTVIHAGYYCICNSERFHGRHCENGDDKDSSLMLIIFLCFLQNTITSIRILFMSRNHKIIWKAYKVWMHLNNVGTI